MEVTRAIKWYFFETAKQLLHYRHAEDNRSSELSYVKGNMARLLSSEPQHAYSEMMKTLRIANSSFAPEWEFKNSYTGHIHWKSSESQVCLAALL